jgi:lipopolysaccharide transport system ATP-binding protein
MAQAAIRICGLSKQYSIGATRGREDTLRAEIMTGLKSLLQPNGTRTRSQQNRFWALRDVSFEVEQGTAIGIIGRNGAGKSTLLKILSRIVEPTSGYAEIRGRLGSLLEVGIGFDRELTGRDNIYLSGAILGMKKREIDLKFDEIVAFAEVERFLDMPVKRYSSGMYMRLAFAVAAHLETEILLVDEVLAVGDAAFQRRCLGKMDDVANQGRTILFVSHNVAAIARLCPRCVWLEQGQVHAFGDTDQLVSEFLAFGSENAGEIVFPEGPGSEFARLLALRLKNARGDKTASFPINEPVTIEIEYEVLRSAVGLRIGISLVTGDGSVLLSTKDLDVLAADFVRRAGRYVSRCILPPDFLNNGRFFVSVGSDFPMIQSHFVVDRALSFTIEPVGGVGMHIPDSRLGLLRVRLPWEVEQLN